jgi:hypothetical protein
MSETLGSRQDSRCFSMKDSMMRFLMTQSTSRYRFIGSPWRASITCVQRASTSLVTGSASIELT